MFFRLEIIAALNRLVSSHGPYGTRVRFRQPNTHTNRVKTKTIRSDRTCDTGILCLQPPLLFTSHTPRRRLLSDGRGAPLKRLTLSMQLLVFSILVVLCSICFGVSTVTSSLYVNELIVFIV